MIFYQAIPAESYGGSLQRHIANYFRPAPLADVQSQLREWLATPTGQYVLKQEQQLLQRLPKMHGYHLMELGLNANGSLLESFDNLHRFSLGATCGESTTGAVADFTLLPLPSDTIETAVVHHTLEFSTQPHTMLNEVARVVAPGGHIMLFVFNPFCLRGVVKWPGCVLTKQAIFRHHSLRLGRVVDWLRLLNFHPVDLRRGGMSLLPKAEQDKSSWWQRWGYGLGLPAGSFYTIVARKQVLKVLPPRQDILKNFKVSGLSWQQGCHQQQVPLPRPLQVVRGEFVEEC